MHAGFIKPLSKKDTDYAYLVQEQSDKDDARVLSGIQRQSVVEEGLHVHKVVAEKNNTFAFIKPTRILLSNGATVLYANNSNIPKIEILISLAKKHYDDPENYEGLGLFVANAIIEGTKNYPGHMLADVIESCGMSLRIIPGQISLSMLSQDFVKGLEILKEVLTNATFKPEAIEKIRQQMMADLKEYWDEPTSFVSELATKAIYNKHPYSKNILGTYESLQKITHADIAHAYHTYMSLDKARIAIVGDISPYTIPDLVNTYLGSIPVSTIKPTVFPPIIPIDQAIVTYPLNRDQVVLALIKPSISRIHKNFDKILLFDQIFTGGVLGSMSSRLFELREQSGLFYTVGGSLLFHADEQSGMVFIKTIVSLDRLEEAEKALKASLVNETKHITQQELEEAQRALINSLVDNFSSNQKMASTFLYLERFGFPPTYFDTRASELQSITRQEVLEAVNEIMDNPTLITIKVGRV
jgi:zinc protease